jgi:putative tryptophan/tyrosine transport system substrate-binding protein
MPLRQRRRALLQMLAGVFATALVGARAAGAEKRIGVLIPLAESDTEAQREIGAFRAELGRLGWAEGEAVRIHYRWSGGDFARLQSLARELLALKPDVIVTRTTPATAAVLQETRSVPVVFFVVADPVGDRIVQSLPRPGGNVTGFTNVEASLGGKWLELLKEMAPGMQSVGALYNPKTAPGGGAYYLQLVNQAAQAMRVNVVALRVSDVAQAEAAIESLGRAPNGGLLVMPDGFNVANRKRIIAAAARHRLPAMYPIPTFTVDGGLASYGVDIPDLYRRGAAYVDRILRGAKPSELPVQAPVKFELTVNRQTAKALGLALPGTLLLRADRVIE